MAKQGFYTDPWRKELEVFQNFSGGMNTVTSDDNMEDHELTDALNVSFDERGSVTRRTGSVSYIASPVNGTSQGHFRHYRTSSTYDEFVAVDGKLYKNGTLVPNITFQSTRTIEAVQWRGMTYIATGTRLLQYDGTTVSPVAPHAPEPLEALYIGLNAIAPDPYNFMNDGVGSTLNIAGVTFSSRYGVMNENFTLTGFHTAPSGTAVQYRFEYRYPFMADGAYHTGQEWSDSKTWTFQAVGEGDMQFRVNARIKDDPNPLAVAQYLIPKYTIKPAKDPTDVDPVLSGIHTCNRIILHWERLIIYGDTTNFNTVYISHLKNPNYFPIPNNLQFETSRNEPVNTVVRFRDHLVAFTDTSIQALFGKAPSDFRRSVLNTSVGCIAPLGAVVMDNYISFLSADGIYYLKSIGYVDDKANVARLDNKVSNQIPRGNRNAVLVMHNDQLHAFFPDTKQRFRYYKSMQVWTKDESPYLDIYSALVLENELYAQRSNGQVIKFSGATHKDVDHIYKASFTTRYLDFGMPYHSKKLKELQVLAKAEEVGQVANIKVFLDGVNKTENILTYVSNFSEGDSIDSTYKEFIDKLKVSGKCLRVKIEVEHTLDDWITFLGFSIIHKTKKP